MPAKYLLLEKSWKNPFFVHGGFSIICVSREEIKGAIIMIRNDEGAVALKHRVVEGLARLEWNVALTEVN